MGVIWAKFRKEKSTEQVLEALQEKIDTLETFTVNTQEQKKRIVSNFLAVSVGVYVIAFAAFYFIYFPPTWQERLVYFIPLLLFPIIIYLLRYLFTWYFQRKLNKNSKKLTALRAEKKKILEQVMDKETYKVAVNLLARFADKPSKTSFALSSTTPSKFNQTSLNRSLPTTSLTQKSQKLALTPSSAARNTSSAAGYMSTNTPLRSQINTLSSSPASTTALMTHSAGGVNQQLRRRTPFPIINQQEKGVFDRIVDVLIGDGPQDRFAMICKECYAHNGMALKEDFEYTTFRCAFCQALNPARKSRPAAPRLSTLPSANLALAKADSDTSDSDDKDDSDDEPLMKSNSNSGVAAAALNSEANPKASPSSSTPSSDAEESQKPENPETKTETQNSELKKEDEEAKEEVKSDSSFEELITQLEKSDSAIDTMSPEE